MGGRGWRAITKRGLRLGGEALLTLMLAARRGYLRKSYSMLGVRNRVVNHTYKTTVSQHGTLVAKWAVAVDRTPYAVCKQIATTYIHNSDCS